MTALRSVTHKKNAEEENNARSIREPQCRCCIFVAETKMHREFQKIRHEF